MEGKSKSDSSDQISFAEIVKKAYEEGLRENELTVGKLLEDLKSDLKNMMIS